MKNTDKYYVIICFYMNDMLILDSNDHMIKFTKKLLIDKRLEYCRYHTRNTNF
jgi:hypothetical protein